MEFNLDIFIAQLANFIFIYVWFKYFVWDKIRNLIEHRKWLDEKYSNVERDIENILSEAEQQKRSILDDALAHKQQLIQQSEAAARLKGEKILADAKISANNIESKAKQDADKLESDLKNEYVSGVKRISQLVLKKIMGKDTNLQDSYIEEVMKQVG